MLGSQALLVNKGVPSATLLVASHLSALYYAFSVDMIRQAWYDNRPRIYGGKYITRGHVRHNTTGIAHRGRAGGTRPGKSLKGNPQAAEAATKVDQGIYILEEDRSCYYQVQGKPRRPWVGQQGAKNVSCIAS